MVVAVFAIAFYLLRKPKPKLDTAPGESNSLKYPNEYLDDFEEGDILNYEGTAFLKQGGKWVLKA